MNSKSNRFALPLLVALILSSCDKMPEGAVVLPSSEVDQILKQCSRDAPEKGETTWTPSATDIQEFEKKLSFELPRELSKVTLAYASERERFAEFPTTFERQYVGIVRHGRKYIYGSFGPKETFADAGISSQRARVVCDGGPAFFGAELDTNANRFTHWAFNGPLG